MSFAKFRVAIKKNPGKLLGCRLTVNNSSSNPVTIIEWTKLESNPFRVDFNP